MRDWQVVRLDDVADISISNVDKKSVASERPVRLCNYMDVYSNDYIDGRIAFMEATASLAEIERFKVQRGDILITKDSETPDDIGIPAVVMEDVQGLVAGYHLALIRPRRDLVDSVYLAKQMSAERVVSHFSRRAAGSTRYGLSTSTIASTPILVAPLPVQRHIAEILSTLDSAIERTQALIAKRRVLKTGSMHDLLTRGVLPNGSLRPGPAAAPGFYTETPIGPLPTGWTCQPLEALLAPVPNAMRSGPFGSALLTAELVEEGIPFLGIDNIFSERFVASYRRFLSRQKYLSLARYAVRPADVIITIMGTVGRCCVVPDDLEVALSSKHLWTMTFDREKALPDLICWQLNHATWVKRWFDRHAQGAVMDTIQSSTLKTLRLPVPPLAEQEIICERYRSLSSAVSVEEATLGKLKQQRQGLMCDVLAGRVSFNRQAA
jgi:type I restriction enzyme S subunit